MRLLDGWKTWISAVVWVGVALWALISGQDISPIVVEISKMFGWETPAGELLIRYGLIANLLLAAWGVVAKVWKAIKQYKAGASLKELLSAGGFIKAAAEDGTLRTTSLAPVTLLLTGKNSGDSVVVSR